jgi:hypothetical protein
LALPTCGFFINFRENGYRLLVCVFDPDQVGDEYRLSGVRTVIPYLNYCTVEAGCFASAQVVVPNSQQISCLDGSFLECSLPAREARVRSPAGTCQSRDL